MTRFVTVTIASLLITAAAAFGQTKVGSKAFPFLTLSSSPRASAMGTVAVPFRGPQSFEYNPGSLGLTAARPQVVVAPFVWTDDYGPSTDYYSGSFLIPLRLLGVGSGSRISLGLAGYFTQLKGDGQQEISYSPAATQSLAFTDRAYHVLAGAEIDGAVQAGLGVGFTYLRESLDDSGSTTSDGTAFDLGAIVRLPLALTLGTGEPGSRLLLTPSVGASTGNRGPSVDIGDNSYPLPWINRVGAGVEAAVDMPGAFDRWHIVSAAVGAEVEKEKNAEAIGKFGAEIGTAEALFLRVGHSDAGDGFSTWGYAVRSSGLVKLLVTAAGGDPHRGIVEFLARRLAVEYSQSRYELSMTGEDVTLRGIIMSYRYGE